MECAICKKVLSRYYAVRIGGVIEQITGKQYMCRECVRRVHSGEVKVVVW